MENDVHELGRSDHDTSDVTLTKKILRVRDDKPDGWKESENRKKISLILGIVTNINCHMFL